MSLLEHEFTYLTRQEAEAITSQSEREFALRCLAVGCLLVHQVQVGMSTIDFLVINPRRRTETGALTEGKLVEVTLMSEDQKDKKFVKRHHKDKGHKTLNTTGQRKDRQIQAMEASGYSWTILYKESIRRLLRGG